MDDAEINESWLMPIAVHAYSMHASVYSIIVGTEPAQRSAVAICHLQCAICLRDVKVGTRIEFFCSVCLLRHSQTMDSSGEKSYQIRLNQTHPTVSASKNVNELSALLMTSCPEILDNRLTDKAARAKVFELLLLNAWRRRRSDVERCNVKVANTEKLLLKVKEQKTSVDTLLRFEQQRYHKLLRTAEAVRSENDDLTVRLGEREEDNAALRTELEAKIRAAEQLMTDLQAAQHRLDDMSATEMELRTKIDEYKQVIEDMQCANRALEEKVARLSSEMAVSDAGRQQAMETNDTLAAKERECRQLLDAKENNEMRLTSDAVALRHACDEYRRLIERKDAEVRRLRAAVDGAFMTRLQNLARHCLMVATASLYHMSRHMLPAMPPPPPPPPLESSGTSATGHGNRARAQIGPMAKNEIPFVIAAPLLALKTMNK